MPVELSIRSSLAIIWRRILQILHLFTPSKQGNLVGLERWMCLASFNVTA